MLRGIRYRTLFVLLFCNAAVSGCFKKEANVSSSTKSQITITSSGQSSEGESSSLSSASSSTSSLTSSLSSSSSSSTTPSPSPLHLSAVWANDGGDKVAQNELRASTNPNAVFNSLWNGQKIKIKGAKNEIVSFNLILESANSISSSISLQFDSLSHSNGFSITTVPKATNHLSEWVGRNIELFYIRYLQIKGLSRLSYETYDERHVPKRMRRPYTGAGIGSGTWSSRPDHDLYYPEIAVPIELHPAFSISAQKNQSVWVDIYIPKNTPTGLLSGSVKIFEGSNLSYTIPVELMVNNFTLPDRSSAQTMVNIGYSDIAERYTGVKWPNAGSAQDTKTKLVRDRHFQLAHRHKISLIDSDPGATTWTLDRPRPEWINRLDGSLYTSAQNYDGPGVGIPHSVYSIGTYSSWSWKSDTESDMRTHSDAWVNWFQSNAPNTDFFLYLIDESTNYAQIEQWAQWIKNNPGPGKLLSSFATMDLTHAFSSTPHLDISASWMAVGDNSTWQTAHDQRKLAQKKVYMYNGRRPASGSFATEDDGIALRQMAWAQFKKQIDRWFFWESTYYNDFQSGRGQNRVFQNAVTFGLASTQDSVIGETGWNHSNGDGVLFYPGTDKVFLNDSYEVDTPFASLRLKHWRRGIQDADYLALARAKNALATDAIIEQMIPKVLWENGIADQNDPTWQRCDVSWSDNPDVWESARSQLAQIIESP